MKRITWNVDKAERLRIDDSRNRVGFEECVTAIEDERILALLPNPNYPNQLIFILEVEGYAYVVPFVETDDEISLKTVFPSRKHTALYLTRQDNDET